MSVYRLCPALVLSAAVTASIATSAPTAPTPDWANPFIEVYPTNALVSDGDSVELEFLIGVEHGRKDDLLTMDVSVHISGAATPGSTGGMWFSVPGSALYDQPTFLPHSEYYALDLSDLVGPSELAGCNLTYDTAVADFYPGYVPSDYAYCSVMFSVVLEADGVDLEVDATPAIDASGYGASAPDFLVIDF